MAPDTYRVTYEGGEPTARLNALLMYRCAELAVGKGHSSFNIVYGYNRGNYAAAIIRLGPSLTGSESTAWHNSKQTLEQLNPIVQVPPHEFMPSPRLSFELGTTENAVKLPFVITSIDSHTYRVELHHTKTNPTGASPDESKLLDHTLWYRMAQFTVDSGADYFVILSGDGRSGSYYSPGGLRVTGASFSYNERSVVLRLFKGAPPASLPSAFLAKDILESARVELRLPDQKIGRVSTSSLEDTREENGNYHEDNARAQQVLFRDPSRLAFRMTPLELEERLFVRCASVTLDDGYDYFAFVKEERRISPSQQEKPGDFVENGYAGGTPVFSGQYGPDMKLDDIRVWIREFRKDDKIPPGLFVFDAQDVMHNIGQRL